MVYASLNLYYKEIGRRDYKNEHGKGKFMQFMKESKMDQHGFEEVLRDQGADADYIQRFDSRLFEHKRDRKQRIFDIVKHYIPNSKSVNENEFCQFNYSHVNHHSIGTYEYIFLCEGIYNSYTDNNSSNNKTSQF